MYICAFNIHLHTYTSPIYTWNKHTHVKKAKWPYILEKGWYLYETSGLVCTCNGPFWKGWPAKILILTQSPLYWRGLKIFLALTSLSFLPTQLLVIIEFLQSYVWILNVKWGSSGEPVYFFYKQKLNLNPVEIELWKRKSWLSEKMLPFQMALLEPPNISLVFQLV